MKKINWFRVLDTTTFALGGATLIYMWLGCCLFFANFLSDSPYHNHYYNIASIVFFLGLFYGIFAIIRGIIKKLKEVRR